MIKCIIMRGRWLRIFYLYGDLAVQTPGQELLQIRSLPGSAVLFTGCFQLIYILYPVHGLLYLFARAGRIISNALGTSLLWLSPSNSLYTKFNPAYFLFSSESFIARPPSSILFQRSR